MGRRLWWSLLSNKRRFLMIETIARIHLHRIASRLRTGLVVVRFDSRSPRRLRARSLVPPEKRRHRGESTYAPDHLSITIFDFKCPANIYS
jgi:hypothetical protein